MTGACDVPAPSGDQAGLSASALFAWPAGPSLTIRHILPSWSARMPMTDGEMQSYPLTLDKFLATRPNGTPTERW